MYDVAVGDSVSSLSKMSNKMHLENNISYLPLLVSNHMKYEVFMCPCFRIFTTTSANTPTILC